jgi:hypothetical protein
VMFVLVQYFEEEVINISVMRHGPCPILQRLF